MVEEREYLELHITNLSEEIKAKILHIKHQIQKSQQYYGPYGGAYGYGAPVYGNQGGNYGSYGSAPAYESPPAYGGSAPVYGSAPAYDGSSYGQQTYDYSGALNYAQTGANPTDSYHSDYHQQIEDLHEEFLAAVEATRADFAAVVADAQ